MTRSALALVLVACSESVEPTPDDVVSRVDLGAEGDLVGVAVEPDSGRRLALVSDTLFVLGDGGYEALDVQPPANGFTDVVAVGDGVVALSAVSDGFLFDTVTGTLTQHFCYEPGFQDEWVEDFQITFALGYDIDRDLLIAQPRTAMFDAPDVPVASFVATYDGGTGETREFYELPQASYRAGGMVAPGADEVWLGVDARLDAYGAGEERPSRFARLDRAGVSSIEGLAIDDVASTLLVADAGGEVVEIRSEAVGR